MIYKYYKIVNNNLHGGNLNKVLQNSNSFIKYDSYDEDNKTVCPITKPFLCILNSKNPGLCFINPENCNIQFE